MMRRICSDYVISISGTALTAACALLCGSAALAQNDESTMDRDSPGLVVEARAGWDGTVDRAAPVPVSLLLSNFSDRDIEGHLILSDPRNGWETDLGEIYLSAGATRRFTSIQAFTGWSDCYVALIHDAEVLWRRNLSLNTGSSFNANISFALVINDSQRNPDFPAERPVAVTNPSAAIAGSEGRPVRFLHVKSWQVPTHPGPLISAQAMIFPEDTPDDNLNGGQWHAIARWMCMGGTVFVHAGSPEVTKRLVESSLMRGELPVQQEHFAVRRIGLGAICEYAPKLFTVESLSTRQAIAETIAKLNRQHLCTSVDSVHPVRPTGRADRNRMLMVACFGLYTVFSGLIALLLMRRSRRSIVAYMVGVVGTASILSGLLGGVLRMSSGDLTWASITQAGAGGVIQMGRIDVQSAGGRNTQVAITGENADLQATKRQTRSYRYWNNSTKGFPPFSWQPNQARGVENTYQVNVPITSWGRRQLMATGIQSDLRRMDFELTFQPRDQSVINPTDDSGVSAAEEASQLIDMPSGKFSLNVVNHLPFTVFDCRLVIGTAAATDAAVANGSRTTTIQVIPSGGLSRPIRIRQSPGSMNPAIEIYHVQELPTLLPNATHQLTFDAGFRIKADNVTFSRRMQHDLHVLPKVSHVGAVSAWLVGRLEESPIIAIDDSRSDFVTQAALHVFIQEILPEDMPDNFVRPAKISSPASTD